MNVLNTLLVEHDQNIFMLFLKVVLQLDVLKIKNKFPVLLFPPALEDIKSSMRMKQETLRNYLFKMARFIVYSFFVEHFAGRALLKSDCTARRQFLTRLCLLSSPLQSLADGQLEDNFCLFPTLWGRVLQTVITKNEFK